MNRRPRTTVPRLAQWAALSALSLGITILTAAAGPASLSFEDRVEARLKVERLHISWRGGDAAESSRADLQVAVAARVRRELAYEAALRRRYKEPVTSGMAAAELERMIRGSRSPLRLAQVMAALDDDTALAAEILARPALARRHLDRRFAWDAAIHAGARKAAEALREDLLAGRLDPWADRPDRLVLTRGSMGHPLLVPEQAGDPLLAVPGAPPLRPAGAEAFDALLAGAPAAPGDAGEVEETRRGFRLLVTLEISAGREAVAIYQVPKIPFDRWWASVAEAYEAEAAEALPLSPVDGRPGAGILSGPVPPACPVDDTWTPIDPNGGPPQERMAHTAVWTGAEMIVWGGWSGTAALSTGGLYDPVLDTWTPTATVGAPEKRYWHAAVWTGTEMIVWGGADQGLYLPTGGRYDPLTDTWSETTLTGAPRERAATAAAWTGDRLLVWGGYDGTIFGLTYLGDGALYDPSTDSWAPVSSAGAPTAREPVSAWLDGRLMIWSGTDGASWPADGALYDPNTDGWSPIDPNGAPTGRAGSTLVWNGSEALLWGGEDGSGPVDGGGAYDPAGDTWRALPTSGGPGARTLHTAVWSGDRMVVWGGWNGSVLLDDGARYSPFYDDWTPATLSGSPASRDQHAAVWAGDHMIVWGGWNGSDGDGTGGGYEVADLDVDGLGTCDGDCLDTDPNVYPGAPQICDGINNDCAFPGWPTLAGTNEADNDLDSFSQCQGDCNDADSSVWSAPGEVGGLIFLGDAVTLQWTPPSDPGATTVLYDTLRGDGAPQFTGAATCAESDGGDLTTVDATVPPPGVVLYYLARAVNGCPAGAGNGSLGSGSNGVPRNGLSCP